MALLDLQGMETRESSGRSGSYGRGGGDHSGLSLLICGGDDSSLSVVVC